jgi:hypothetical protein
MQKRLVLALVAAAVLALTAWALWPGGGPAADVQRLADRVARGVDTALEEEAKRVADKYPTSGPLMSLLRKRDEKGGLGIGRNAGAVQPDGIEAKIAALAKTAPTPAELAEEGEALVRMAHVTAAVALVVRSKCEVRQKVGLLDPKDWDKWTDAMRLSSLELADAVRAGDGARVKAVAARLHATCASCHRIFRE